MSISHELLNQKAAAYAHKSLNAGIVLVEHRCSGNSEVIDVAAFRNSIVINIEVKVSRNDFHKDKTKAHRQPEASAMGHYRFYCTPAGLLKPEELPPGWGLLEYHETSGKIRLAHGPDANIVRHLQPIECYEDEKKIQSVQPFYFQNVNERAHTNLLFSAYRQLLFANEQGIEVELDAIFKRPDGLTFRSELRGTMKNV